MGSFNVACSVSNISINCGDEAVFIPLELAKHPYGIGDGNCHLIYANAFYIPATLPLFGTYADYGTLDVEETASSKFIKDKLNIKEWNHIMPCVEDKNSPVKSGMYLHRKVYDALADNKMFDEWGKENTAIGHWNTEENSMVDYYDAGRKSMKEKMELNENHIRNFTKYLKDEKEKSEILELEHCLDNCKKQRDNIEDLYLDNSNWFTFNDYVTFSKLYRPEVIDGNFKEELINFANFQSALGATNNIFFPTQNGYQCGNPYMSKKVLETSLDVANSQIKQQEELNKLYG